MIRWVIIDLLKFISKLTELATLNHCLGTAKGPDTLFRNKNLKTILLAPQEVKEASSSMVSKATEKVKC